MRLNFFWIDRQLLKNYFFKPLLLALVLLGVLFLLNKFTYFNFSLGSNNTYNTFEVVGVGKVSATPNIATTSYTITETAATEEAARSEANNKQNQALAELKKIGIEESDITSNIYVNPNYEIEPLQSGAEPLIYPPTRQVQNGYTATVTTEIKSKDVEMINQAIDSVTTIGATVSGVSYTLDDQEKYKQEATILAVQDAKKQAEAIAKTAGFKVGNIVTIRNADENFGYPQPYAAEGMLKSSAPDNSTNLQPGENEVTARMGITYTITY